MLPDIVLKKSYQFAALGLAEPAQATADFAKR